jgi:polyisoprenoid-binding protein YceI
MIDGGRLVHHSYRHLAAVVFLALAAAAAYAAVRDYTPSDAGNGVTFFAHSTGHDFQGKSSRFDGKFGCDRERIVESAYGELRVPVRSLATGIRARDAEMLKTFEADRYPEITFKLAKLENVRWIGTDSFTARAVGSFAMHGKSKEVSVPLGGVFSGDQLSISGVANLKITDYGMTPPGFLVFRVADEVRISFKVAGKAIAR